MLDAKLISRSQHLNERTDMFEAPSDDELRNRGLSDEEIEEIKHRQMLII